LYFFIRIDWLVNGNLDELTVLRMAENCEKLFEERKIKPIPINEIHTEKVLKLEDNKRYIWSRNLSEEETNSYSMMYYQLGEATL
jgi:hypothetical protein